MSEVNFIFNVALIYYETIKRYKYISINKYENELWEKWGETH